MFYKDTTLKFRKMIEEGATGVQLSDALLSDIKRTSGLASRYSQDMDIEEPVVDLETQIRGRYEQEFKESTDYLSAKENLLSMLEKDTSVGAGLDNERISKSPKLNLTDEEIKVQKELYGRFSKGLGSRPEKDEGQSIADFIASFEQSEEKESYEAYWDEKQYSIGFGTKAKSKDEVITHEEALSRLQDAAQKAREDVVDVAEKFGYDWNEDQIKALTSFTYNLGRTNLLRLTENGTRGTEEISDMILEYDKVGNTVKPGLTERRQAEYELFSAGSIVD